jgi:hypothetical protein
MDLRYPNRAGHAKALGYGTKGNAGCCTCSCTPCKNTCACTDTPRRWLTRQKIKVDANNPGVAVDISMCAIPDGVVPTMYIRRRGQECWSLSYDASEIDAAGRFVYQFDRLLFQLALGRYEGQIRLGCHVCGSIELDLTQSCSLSPRAATAIAAFEPHIISTTPPGVTDMFPSAVTQFKAILCKPLAADDTELPLNSADAAALCLAASGLCTTVQMLMFDSIKSETITVTGCMGNTPIIERGVDGSAARPFPVGAVVQFTWTSENVRVACEGCP